MKKRYLLILLLFATFMVGCGTSSKNNTQGPANPQETDNNLIASKNKVYLDTLFSYMSATRNIVNAGNIFRFYDTNVLYMVPVGNDATKSCIGLETGGQSPFSDTWNYAFVGVKFTGQGYYYFLIAEDSKGYGIPFSTQQALDDNKNLIYTSDNVENKELSEYLKKKYNEAGSGKVDLSVNDKKMIELKNELLDVEKIEYISAPTCKNEY